jgi:hypothetical protein
LQKYDVVLQYFFFWDKLNECDHHLKLTLELMHLSGDCISQFATAVNLSTNYGMFAITVISTAIDTRARWAVSRSALRLDLGDALPKFRAQKAISGG